MCNETLIEVLQKAKDMEQKGYNFYKDAAEKSNNKITKKTFAFLADSEILHIESINIFFGSLKDGGEFPDVDLHQEERGQSSKIFSNEISQLGDKIKQSDDDVKACEFALEFEKSGYEYYEFMLKQATDDKLKKLLEFLIQEEKSHYESIMKVYDYIQDTGNWFMYEEGAFPQG